VNRGGAGRFPNWPVTSDLPAAKLNDRWQRFRGDRQAKVRAAPVRGP